MSFSFTEDALRSAAIKADWYEVEALPTDNDIDHEFSHEFGRKMRKLIHISKENSKICRWVIWRKRMAILIATIIILCASAMSVSAIQTPVVKFITDVYEKLSHIFFEQDQSSQSTTDQFIAYEPTFIPEDFELVNRIVNGHVLLEYEKADDFISYSQQRLEDVSMNINTEGIELEELEFKGLTARYYSNQGLKNLIWYNEEYMFMVSSTLDRDTIFRIAESIKVNES
jgi:hypothetical protein